MHLAAARAAKVAKAARKQSLHEAYVIGGQKASAVTAAAKKVGLVLLKKIPDFPAAPADMLGSPAPTLRPRGERPTVERWTYGHGDASMWAEYHHPGKTESLPQKVRAETGHGFVDLTQVAEFIERTAGKPCENCRVKCPKVHTSTTHRGIAPTMEFTCEQCKHTTELKGSTHLKKSDAEAKKGGAPVDEANARVVSAAFCAGIGMQQANAFLLGMDMPGFNPTVWQRWANATTDAAKTVLQRRIEANIEKERMATLLYEGESARGPDGRIKCTFITDGSWQKRYGRNSLWGYGVMYGLYTGLVCFVSHRCARCATCMRAAVDGVAEVPEHDCTKNWDEKSASQGAAGNMEADIAVEGVKFLFEHGVIVANLVCDGDTKSLAAIKAQCPPEVAEIIKAHLDLNHVAKNLGAKIRAITAPARPFKLSETESAALQGSFTTAVYKAREESAAAKEDEGAATARMQSAIAAACDHHFDKHAGCGPWCKAKYPPAAPPSAVAGGVGVGVGASGDGDPLRAAKPHVPHKLKRGYLMEKFYAEVRLVFDTYSTLEMARRLCFACSTNTAESGNGVLWLWHMPKTFFQSTSGAGHLAMAQLHKDSGKNAARAEVQAEIGLAPACEANHAEAMAVDAKNARCARALPWSSPYWALTRSLEQADSGAADGRGEEKKQQEEAAPEGAGRRRGPRRRESRKRRREPGKKIKENNTEKKERTCRRGGRGGRRGRRGRRGPRRGQRRQEGAVHELWPERPHGEELPTPKAPEGEDPKPR